MNWPYFTARKGKTRLNKETAPPRKCAEGAWHLKVESDEVAGPNLKGVARRKSVLRWTKSLRDTFSGEVSPYSSDLLRHLDRVLGAESRYRAFDVRSFANENEFKL